ncbi:30S ribosomal protein S20 [Candidatus Poribacteria bacterium]|jgi:small subunit ribosomal protein S20|nr:30S ribosomal protein S20 [Candidatus Poribacteria bacterium]MBT5537046.1 30S ribosomal protein S20 [Candidatus Poribacteria bacterium]MBT5713310.1 30S ribosomal protein S20 [Candidatus Poribacteria bacterium]MBT7100952.1 30S ribosomal protein S20 [Candidatus Poribacteria bacterium]MBT7809011.1 30S ribosomal protein S20 [Candidatus Poribacteria bacterium]
MPNLPSAKKHIRADARKAERNRHTRSTMRTAIKAARVGIAAKDDDAQDSLRKAISKLDKAAKKGVIKKQTASRRKSRLMRLYNREIVAG